MESKEKDKMKIIFAAVFSALMATTIGILYEKIEITGAAWLIFFLKACTSTLFAVLIGYLSTKIGE